MEPYAYSSLNNGGFAAPAALPVHNKKIQNYIFNMNEVLGKGNFSKVYRAINEVTNEVVAIKVVELSSIKTPALVQLLYSEIDILKTLHHPNVLNCLEVFTSANNCYIITELCDGGDVETRIRTRGFLEEREARKLIFEVYQGLKYLAEQNIVHRDIKIANIFYKNGVAKIADFGFARRTNQQWKDINIGSPIYMSPEGLLDNIYGPKTDVWAFGVFLFEILHGDTPLGFCKTESELKSYISNPLPIERIKQTLSNDLKELILKCLEIDERRRISAREIQFHPYMQFISLQFTRKDRSGSSILQLEESKNRDFYSSQESNSLVSKLQPSSLLQPQSNALNQAEGSSPQRNYSKLLSIPSSINRDGKSVSPSSHQLNALSYNALQGNSRKEVSGFQSNNEIKKGVSRDKSYSQSNGWQGPLLNNVSPTPPNMYSNGSQKQGLSDASKLFDQRKQSPSKGISTGKVMVAPMNFQECVQLLHYCRLIYKSVCIANRNLRNLNMKMVDVYSNWLLDMLDEINDKIQIFVKFEGERGAVRKQKLKQVIHEYHSKYNKELKRKSSVGDVNLKSIQTITAKTLFYLDSQIAGDEDSDKSRQMIKLSHYLFLVSEVNKLLESCMQWGNYSQLVKSVNIENFLNNKKQAYDMGSYKLLKQKLFTLDG